VLHPKNIEQKLGFDKIRDYLKNECLSTLGQYYVDRIRFSHDFDLVCKMVRQTEEFQSLLRQQLPFPSSYFIDVTASFEKIRPEGSFLEPDEFKQFKLSVYTITSCLEFLNKHEQDFPGLFLLRKEVTLDKKIYDHIHSIVDDEGIVRDNASLALSEVRRNLQEEQRILRRETDKILRHVKKEGYSEEDVTPTIRNGRMVLPIKAEFKRKIKGFIHDESATGQTSYIEPAEIFDVNNKIKELELEEKREVIKILTKLTDFLRAHLPELKKAFVFLGIIDFVRAKAKLANEMGANTALLENAPIVQWNNARHPLLIISHKKSGKPVVPLSILLNKNQRILLISGPNAGGKSVCLKTVGLIQYMFQCGLPVPVDESSTIGIFKSVFLDIGDEQSLENDLSTYSAHLSNMNTFVKMADKNSLVLIDEFGTGTEPQFGAAIAESVLEELNKLNVFGLITTHYSNLKAFADKTLGMVNGAMAYDIDKLEPQYILEIGKPGSSYALEIAKKIGLSSAIIERSKQKIGSSQVDFDKLIRDLEADKNNLRKLISENEKQNTYLQKTTNEYQQLKDAAEANQKAILKEAKEKAKQLLQEANKKIETTIREIKENKADKELTKLLRTDLENFKEEITEVPMESPEIEVDDIEDAVLRKGDFVKVKDSGALGEIISLKDKEAVLSIGALQSNIKTSRLIKISKRTFRNAIGEEFLKTSESKPFSYMSKASSFSPTLDVRGLRGEEALIEVNQFMDNALILNAKDLKIIHGKGDGVLRTLIRGHLQHYKQVASILDEHADRGGAGATVVKLK